MTFSIVAHCRRTGQLGVAVATAVPAVGALCPYIRPGVGAVSTQSWVNTYLAIAALDAMAAGASAEQALETVLETDEGRDLRQLGVVDASGGVANWSGGQCTPWAGQMEIQGCTVQGNMLTGPAVLRAMVSAFADCQAFDLAERLMLALEAGQKAGGDKRGRQSAALKVYGTEDYPLIDLRVDEHAHPIPELRRVFTIAQLQLTPFVAGMPRKGQPAGSLPEAVTTMLLTPPPYRPGAGGSAP
jgi:uncharacterized Ntn-hydrolase superfamily protein